MIAPIIDAAMNRTRTVLSILVLLFLAGSYAYATIPKESSPDIDIPTIYVSLHLQGISPADSERLLLRPMERELSTIDGVKEISSTGYLGGGNVILEFNAGFDKGKALDDVQKAVDKAKPDLPEDADEPSVNEVNFSLFPILVVTLTGDVPERTLLKLAQRLQDRLESIGSVLEAGIAGDREELVEIIVKPELLESYGLKGTEILNFFNLSNRLVAAGNLDTGAGSFAIEVPGLFEDVADIMEMPLSTQGDSAIKVKDIAEIRRTFKDPENFARLNGQRSITLEIVKRSGENVIDTIAAVRSLVAQEKEYWPENVEVHFTQDKSTGIRTMLRDLQNNVISAILLVMIVVVWALGVRAAGLVGVAIPGAFLTGVLVLFSMGLTVNVVVLFSLILSVGMLVDGAIVVTEFADRKMIEGLDRKEAYTLAAKRMAWPIIASTATTLAAFAPLLFWPDVVGEFMKYMPLTLIAVLGASLLMALVFVPVLGSLFGKPGAAGDEKAIREMQIAEDGNLDDLSGATGVYKNVLSAALKIPGILLISCIVLLIGVNVIYGKFGKGVEFFPAIEPEQASVLVHARGNLSIYEKDFLLREVEEYVLDTEGLKTVYTRVGASAQQGSDLAEDVIGQFQVEFTEWGTRPSVSEILEDIRSRTSGIAGLHIETREHEEGPPTGKDIQIEISSRFPELLTPATEFVVTGLNEIGGFIDMEDSRPMPGIDWKMDVDRTQAAKFGLDITTIGYYIRMVTNGLIVAEFLPDDAEDEIDIVIRHDKSDRTLDQLDRVRIETPSGGSVPIGSFVERKAKPSVGTLNRTDQQRIITVKANVPEGQNVDAKVQSVKTWFEDNKSKFDPGVQVSFKGADEEQRNSQKFLMNAFVVALFVMAIILITQFNSFYSAFLILTAVIMSTIGVMIGLLVTGQPFGIVMSGVGVIALAGIVVNNNIVLIDTFDYIRKTAGPGTERNMPMREVILRTGVQRLRPVMLTTITTVVGLLPMVLQANIDFVTRDVSVGAPSTQWWVQLATAIVYGLSFSTVLTLVVTPSLLMLREKASRIRQRLTQKCKQIISGVAIRKAER
jgi:multidrug efflux pump